MSPFLIDNTYRGWLTIIFSLIWTFLSKNSIINAEDQRFH